MDTPTPTSLDPRFRGPLPHMGWGDIIDLVTYGPMGMRSYAMRRRLTKQQYEVMPAQLLLLLLGFFTCGLSWVGVVALGLSAMVPSPRRKGLDTGCSRGIRIDHDPGEWVIAEQYCRPWPPAPAPATRSTAWAAAPRNLGGSHTITTTQFRPCRPD